MALSTVNDNRRQARRFPTCHPATIVLGSEAMISCTVKDISTGGARISVNPHLDLPDAFELFIAAHDLQVRRARVCWRDGDVAGVRFGCDEDMTASRVDTSHLTPFEVCLEQAAIPAHLTETPTRRRLKLYSTAV